MGLDAGSPLKQEVNIIDSFKNILIVEDEVIALEYLTEILKKLGFESVFQASTVQKALKISQKVDIDLVFMDINLGGVVDGVDLSKMLNQKRDIPIVFTTAYRDEETIHRASDTNIAGYLIKPFELEQVEIALIVASKSRLSEKEFIKKVDIGHGYSFDLEQKTLKKDSSAVSLTKKEIDLLYILVKHMDLNLTYEVLKSEVWESQDVSNSTIRDTVSRLKRKLPELDIENISNYGYILKRTKGA